MARIQPHEREYAELITEACDALSNARRRLLYIASTV